MGGDRSSMIGVVWQSVVTYDPPNIAPFSCFVEVYFSPSFKGRKKSTNELPLPMSGGFGSNQSEFLASLDKSTPHVPSTQIPLFALHASLFVDVSGSPSTSHMLSP